MILKGLGTEHLRYWNKNVRRDAGYLCSFTPCTRVNIKDIEAVGGQEEADWTAFRILLTPVANVFTESSAMSALGEKLVHLLEEVSRIQMDLLLHGKVSLTSE